MDQPKTDKTFEESMLLIEQDYNEIVDRARLRNSSDLNNKDNEFRSRPQGVIIEDTANNPIFPIKRPMVDNSQMSLPKVAKQYVEQYSKENTLDVLPWHYVIEFFSENYMIHTTRPMNMSYPYRTSDFREIIKLNDSEFFDETVDNFLHNQYEKQEFFHILIIGNSELDVYTDQMYKKIGQFIIEPLSRIHRFPPQIGSGIFPLNMGKKFKENAVERFSK